MTLFSSPSLKVSVFLFKTKRFQKAPLLKPFIRKSPFSSAFADVLVGTIGENGYPDNSPPGQFAPDLVTNSPSFFYPSQRQERRKCMIPKLNAIEIILRSFIHNQTNYSSFFYPLPSLKFGGELSRGRVV